jgi:hypothetical protein
VVILTRRLTYNAFLNYIHTFHSRFIPEGVADASQILFWATHVLPKLLSCEKYCRRDKWWARHRLIVVISGVSDQLYELLKYGIYLCIMFNWNTIETRWWLHISRIGLGQIMLVLVDKLNNILGTVVLLCRALRPHSYKYTQLSSHYWKEVCNSFLIRLRTRPYR